MEYSEKHMQFINIAIDLMNKNGIKKTTLDDIAHVAGISTPTLYYYFKNKNEVIKGAISQVLLEARENIKASINDNDSYAQQLEKMVLALYESACNTNFILNIDTQIKPEVVSLSRDLINNFNSYFCNEIASILTKAIHAGVFYTSDVQMTSVIITETLLSLLENNIATPGFKDFDYKLMMVITLFINGLNASNYKET